MLSLKIKNKLAQAKKALEPKFVDLRWVKSHLPYCFFYLKIKRLGVDLQCMIWRNVFGSNVIWNCAVESKGRHCSQALKISLVLSWVSTRESWIWCSWQISITGAKFDGFRYRVENGIPSTIRSPFGAPITKEDGSAGFFRDYAVPTNQFKESRLNMGLTASRLAVPSTGFTSVADFY